MIAQGKEDTNMTNQRDSQQRETSTPASEDVARRAYELFQARGGEPGHDLEHWLEAERELSSTSSSEPHEQPRPRRDRER